MTILSGKIVPAFSWAASSAKLIQPISFGDEASKLVNLNIIAFQVVSHQFAAKTLFFSLNYAGEGKGRQDLVFFLDNCVSSVAVI